MQLEYTKFVRKPFVVEAIEVTPENIAELAPLIGVLKEKADGTPFIQVNKMWVPNIYRVYPGFYVTKLDDTIRCYSKKAFHTQFTKADENVLGWVESVNGDETKEVVLGAFGRIVEEVG